MKRICKRLLPVVPILLLLLGWELFARWSNNNLIPTPISTLHALYDLSASQVLFIDTFESVKRVLVGFSIAACLGVGLGFSLGMLPLLRQTTSPLLELLRPIPPIAWIPVAITIFGIGDAS